MTANVSPRSDFLASLVWIAFGIAVIGGSIAMDRMERFNAAAYTAPGLFPGILGAVVTLLGGLLLIRAVRQGGLRALSEPWLPSSDARAAMLRTAGAMALALIYTLVLVGRGLPFWLVTVAFVFVFMLVFYVPEGRAKGGTLRAVVISAVVAVVTSATVTLVFERVFLVRMP